MKKKIILSLLVIVALFTITGCGNSKTENNDKTEKQNEVIKVDIDDITVNLDSTKELNKLSFKYDTKSERSKVEHLNGKNYYMTDYYSNGSVGLRISIEYKEGMTVAEVMNTKTGTSQGNKSFNNIEWKYYEGLTKNKENVYYYAYQYDKDTYLIGFVTNKSIDNLIDIFMNNVSFK